MDTLNNKKEKRWFPLLLGSITMLLTGVIYAWSILKAPLANEFGWNESSLALNFTITMCFFCIGGIAAGHMTYKLGVKIPGMIGAVSACLGFVSASAMSGGSVGMLYLSYGVIGGFGIGVIYNIIVTTVGAWYADKKGFCNGCLMMCFGISTLVLGNYANYLMQTSGWRNVYRLLGIAIGVIAVVASIFLRMPKSGEITAGKTKLSKNQRECFEEHDYPTRDMLKRNSFWRAFFWLVCLIAVGASVVSFAKDLAIGVGASDSLATTMVGVFSICNGLGRIVFGMLYDVAGRKKTMLSANVAAIMAAALLLTSQTSSILAVCVVGLCLTGLSYGAGPTLTSVFTSTFYGQKYFRTNYSVMNLDIMLASFLATIASSLFEMFGNYIVSFLLLLVISIVSLLLSLSLKRP